MVKLFTFVTLCIALVAQEAAAAGLNEKFVSHSGKKFWVSPAHSPPAHRD